MSVFDAILGLRRAEHRAAMARLSLDVPETVMIARAREVLAGWGMDPDEVMRRAGDAVDTWELPK